MKVEILTTPDCANCSILEKMLNDIGVSYEKIDITEKPDYLQKYPIFTAPGLVLNGKLEFTGISRKEKLVEKLKMLK
jgi:glutaredoxin